MCLKIFYIFLKNNQNDKVPFTRPPIEGLKKNWYLFYIISSVCAFLNGRFIPK